MLQIHALGTLSVDGLATRRRLALVAGEKRLALFLYLLLQGRGGVIRRDLLLPLLWPDADDGHARSALRSLVREVRSAVGDGVVVGEGDHGLGVDVTKVRCDVLEFQAACDQREWERAVELYRGRLLDGFGVSGAAGFEEWLEGERGRLAGQAVEACRALATEARARGAHDTAVRALKKALTISPYDERVLRELMEAMAEVGDRAGALVAYEEFVAKLKAELEVEPGAETVAVAEGVRHSVPEVSGEPPYTRPMVQGITAKHNAAPVSSLRAMRDTAPLRRDAAVSRATNIPRPLRLLFVLIAVGIAVLVYLRPETTASGTRITEEGVTVAVLYLENATRDSADDYIADGLTEAITTRLGKLGRFRMKSSNSVRRFRGADAGNLAELGGVLDVKYLVTGRVRRVAQQLTVSIGLVDAETENLVWGDLYRQGDQNLLALEEGISAAVAMAIAGELLPNELSALAELPTQSPEAYDHLARGNYFLARRSPRALERAIGEFRTSAELDPGFATPRAQLAFSYGVLLERGWSLPWRSRDEMLTEGLDAVDSALSLEPRSAEAWMAKGYLLTHINPRSYDGVIEAFETALSLDSGSAEIQHLYAWTMLNLRRDSIATRMNHRSLQLDPMRPITLVNIGLTNLLRRNFTEARRWFDSAIVVDAGFSTAFAYRAHVKVLLGDIAAARRDAETALAIGAGDSLLGNAVLTLVETKEGKWESARARASMLHELYPGEVPASWVIHWVGSALAAVGDTAGALDLLDRAEPKGHRFLMWSGGPDLAGVRELPRFRDFVDESHPRAGAR